MPLSDAVAAHRTQFSKYVEILMSTTAFPSAQREAAQAWFRWAMDVLDLPVDTDPSTPDHLFEQDTVFDNGKAINPRSAARCVQEYLRTARFLRAMDEAIRTTASRFPGETIHVLEAGCGPLAALSLPFALRYPPEQVQFSLLDIHQISLDCSLKLATALGIENSIRRTWCTDAANLQLPANERPHIIACEVMQRALMTEPQVAVTQNLYPQLISNGCFLPERIEVVLALFDAAAYYRNSTTSRESSADNQTQIKPLDVACRLHAPHPAHPVSPSGEMLTTHEVNVPAFRGTTFYPHLFTRIQILNQHVLTDFECSLNLPADVRLPETVGTTKSTLSFTYEISDNPGLIAKYQDA